MLDDVAAQGIDDIVNLGDVFSGPIDASKTAHLLAPIGDLARTVREMFARAEGATDAAASRSTVILKVRRQVEETHCHTGLQGQLVDERRAGTAVLLH